MGCAFVGGAADAEFPVEGFVSVIVGVAFVVVDGSPGGTVGAKRGPVVGVIRQFFNQNKRGDHDKKESP